MYGQLSLFDFINENNGEYKFPKNKVIRLIELFGGVGSQAMAMERLDPPQGWESWRLVEYDKYPVASYNAIHDANYVPTDITKIHGWDLGIVDKDKYSYILCYSFPCQDISSAGKMRGFNKEKQKEEATRSGLLWEVERLLDETPLLPDVLLMENVSNITSKAMLPDFEKWLEYLESKGYSNFWQIMNACEYGVAQSRKRCFCVSILGNYTYKFPEPIVLEKRMKDYLEPQVDEKYYIKTDRARELIDKLIVNGKILTDRQTDRQTCDLCEENPKFREIANSIKAADRGIEGKQAQGNGVLEWSKQTNKQLTCPPMNQTSVISQTVCQHGQTEESVQEEQKVPESVRSIGWIEKGNGCHQSNSVYDPNGLSTTLSATDYKHPELITECQKLKK